MGQVGADGAQARQLFGPHHLLPVLLQLGLDPATLGDIPEYSQYSYDIFFFVPHRGF